MKLFRPILGNASNSKRPWASGDLLKKFKRELPPLQRVFLRVLWQDTLMSMQLKCGAANPAKVVSVEPDLIVSALSTDFDDVIFLKFSPDLAAARGLKIGDRLVTVSSFDDQEDSELAADLLYGPRASRMYTNFQPVLLQFVSDNESAISATMNSLPKWEWERLDHLTEIMAPYRAQFPRNGNPYSVGEENNKVYPTLVKLKRELSYK